MVRPESLVSLTRLASSAAETAPSSGRQPSLHIGEVVGSLRILRTYRSRKNIPTSMKMFIEMNMVKKVP